MSDEANTTWKLSELADAAGVAARTVRYYVQRGLLPSPEFRGPDTAYDRGHLLRLRAIRTLQAQHLPLDEIQRVLDGSTSEELERLAGGGAPGAAAGIRTEASSGAPPSAEAEPTGSSAWEREELAPGVELHVAMAAGADARRLVEAIRALVRGTNGGRR